MRVISPLSDIECRAECDVTLSYILEGSMLVGTVAPFGLGVIEEIRARELEHLVDAVFGDGGEVDDRDAEE
jgi:hypothetical protein